MSRWVMASKYLVAEDRRSILDVAKEAGIPSRTLYQRLKRGIPLERATMRTSSLLSVGEIANRSTFSRYQVIKHMKEYNLTPEEVIELGTCPIHHYLPTGTTVRSLARAAHTTEGTVRKRLRLGDTVEEIVGE